MKCFLLLFILSTNLWAIDELRLDLPPYAGSSMGIQSQESTELCYAYSATYLIDFERNDKDFRGSPLLFGIDYKNNIFQVDSKSKLIETPNLGITCEAINMAKRIFKKESDNNIVENGKFNQFISSLKEAYLNQNVNDNNTTNVTGANCSILNILNDLLGMNKSIETLNKTLGAPEFINFLAKTLLEDENAKKINYQCTEAQLQNNNSDVEVRGKLEEGLNLKKPVAITYCSKVLLNGNATETVTKISEGILTQKISYMMGPNCKPHASVIVGKRIKDGLVQYLIQDSMGEKFNYHPDFEKENGRIWIDQSVLYKNLLGASFISN